MPRWILLLACLVAHASAQVRVVATTSMIADLCREIGGDRVAVTALMGQGVDPHLYSPTRTDNVSLIRADVIFCNGLLLEGKMKGTFDRLRRQGRPVHEIATALDKSELLTDAGLESHPDPHLWMDPKRWAKTIPMVRDALVTADPDGKAHYTARAESYAERLKALDAYATTCLASVPEGQRTLVTSHDAFNYLGDRFGYEVVGIQGISTESEAGVRDVETLVNTIVTRRIGAVFVETSVSDKGIRALVEGARARGHTVVIGGSLYSDAMGPAGTYEGTYVGMIDHNATTIARALGGQAPERGMSGSLR